VSRPKVVVAFGTRPEAIKLAPVINALRRIAEVRVCVTAQHREMLDQVLRVFEIAPDCDLDLMRPAQDLCELTGAALSAMRDVIAREQPRLVVVQGDTTTTMAAALAGYYAHVPVAHVEAGLRTDDTAQPFPEEINRRITATLAALHFAPTQGARANLLAEGVSAERITVTGNTGIDALLVTVDRLRTGQAEAMLPKEVAAGLSGRRLILVTGHRRESFGPGFRNICEALRVVARQQDDVVIVYPVHLNPSVRGPVRALLQDTPSILLTEPLDYPTFVALMQRAEILLTDSGGIQEEAPSLGKPVLVLREKTERPEGVAAGLAQLVGTDPERICGAVAALLSDAGAAARVGATPNPYGDGQAAARIADVIRRYLGEGGAGR